MKLGIRADTWPNLTPIEEFKKAAEYGFTYVNVCAFHSKKWRGIDKEAIKVFKDLGLVSMSLSTSAMYQACASDPVERQRAFDIMKRGVELQLELGGNQIGSLVGCYTMDYPREQAWHDSVTFHQEFATWAQQFGILIDVETEPEAYHTAFTLEDTIRWHQQIDMPNVFCNLDTGHLNLMRVPPKALEPLRGKLIHCHITDEKGWAHEEIALGSGTTDNVGYIHKILELGIDETARAHGIEPVTCIEMEDKQDIDAALKASLAHLAEVLPELTL